MKIFIDTNILVYTIDSRDLQKRESARALLAGEQPNRFVISTQVLQEFYVVAVKKYNVPPLRAKKIVQSLAWMQVITITPELIERAIDIQILNELSFWDALIVAAAAAARCAELWTEDLGNGQQIAGVKVVNPMIVHSA